MPCASQVVSYQPLPIHFTDSLILANACALRRQVYANHKIRGAKQMCPPDFCRCRWPHNVSPQ